MTPRPRILVTRSPHQASALADELRALGAEPILIPTIELATPTSFAPLDAAIADLASFDWLLFTSANAVEAFHDRSLRAAENSRLKTQDSQLSMNAVRPRIAAIGAATARALTVVEGYAPDLVPPQATAESFAAALLPHVRRPDGAPTQFLLVRAEEAREHLPETLRAAGASVAVVPAYRNIVPAASAAALRALFRQAPPDAVTFTSSSTARNLLGLLAAAGVALPEAVVRASIGPVTTQTLVDLGLPPHTESPEATVASLARNLVKYLNS